jgi:hypothetical protein
MKDTEILLKILNAIKNKDVLVAKSSIHILILYKRYKN